jgi:hypothetical protein
MPLKASLFLVIVVLVLNACTGTFEARNPVLLVTSYRDNKGSHVALIRDSFGESGESGGSRNRLQFVPNSVRSLPAPAVSYDIVDRGGTRSSLVVLSRAPTADGTSTGYLTFFSLSGIDPDIPEDFGQTREQVVISPTTIRVVPDTVINPRFCPSNVQVTQTGTYAAVLNEPRLCRLGGQPHIDIFDLRSEPRISLLQRIGGVAGDGIYLSQSPTQDALFYATNESRSLRLQRALLPRPGQTFGSDDTVTVEQVVDVTRITGNDFVDLGLSGIPGDERLVVLFERSLVTVTDFTGTATATATASTPVDTPPNNARVIRDDLRDTEATLILGTREAQRFTYVPPSASDDENIEPESADVSAVDAVIEPTYGFVYFVANRRISLFDLNSYDASETLPDPTPFIEGLGPLTDPSFITWTQSVPATP